MAAGRRRALAPIGRHHGDLPRTLRALLGRSRQVELGRLNNTLEVAINNNGIATSTAYTIPGVRSTSVVLLMPLDANSAAILQTVWPVPTKDTVTLNHPATATARSYRLAVFA